MKQAVVALIGRPNVGKSALFNRLTGKARAIVDEMPGITRDRICGVARWQDREFILVDTGGIEVDSRGGLAEEIQQQTQIALAEADLILWVVDGRTPLAPADRQVADRLRRARKPVLLVVNKIDNESLEADAQAFWSLGFDQPYAVSALHGRRIDELLDAVRAKLPRGSAGGEEPDELLIKLAVAGRPNVGKSSLVNKLLGENRMLVSEAPGTTRDAVDARFEHAGKTLEVVDTAGLRAPKKIARGFERFAVVRSLRSIKESHVVLFLLEATSPPTEQDERIAGFIHEAGRACIIVVNKWDLIRKDGKTTAGYTEVIRRRFPFLDYAPIITLSAKTGQRLTRLLDLIAFVDEQHVMRIKTSLLNQTLRDILYQHPAPSSRGKPLKINYIAQTGVRPPAFALFVNEAKRMHFTYLRHIKNGLRARFGLEGTPLIIMLRGQREAKSAG